MAGPDGGVPVHAGTGQAAITTGTGDDETVDVVVVGAGPVGMTAAALLDARGVSVTVLERHAVTSDAPKAISVDDEALRTMQAAGVGERVAQMIVPGIGTRYYDAGGRPAFLAGSGWPYRLGHSFKNPFAQPDLERGLADHLRAATSARLRMGTEVLSLVQGPDDVTVTTSSGDTVRARYLLGCDGGRSIVRDELGTRMHGRSFDDVWLVADVLGDAHDQRYGLHHADPARPTVIVPGLRGRCRYEFLLKPDECAAGVPPPFELLVRLLRPHRDITPEQVERSVAYRFHALVADRFARDRVFLLGDAAHMMPPFAGQGLNSGIRDAANVTWKIADVLAGRLDGSALASYDAERRPHAEEIVRFSVRLGRVVMTTDTRLAERRDRLIEKTLRTPAGRRYLEETRYRPAARYREGLVVPSGDEAGDGPPSGVPFGQPRVFDTATAHTRMLDDVLGRGWALLGVDVPPGSLVEATKHTAALDPVVAYIPTDERFPRAAEGLRVLLGLDGALEREAAPYRGRVVLVRPDHFVAASWTPAAVSSGAMQADLTAALHLVHHEPGRRAAPSPALLPVAG